MVKKNDVSFTINDTYLVITEHQSTINPNMPLRDLWYIAEIYRKMTDKDAPYKGQKVMLPRPTFVVMYNGTDPMPPESRLELSDSFLGTGENLLNLSVIVYNVNEGAGCSLLDKCPTLAQYSQLVALIREHKAKGPVTHQMRKEIYDTCLERGILVDFMKDYGLTIIDMLSNELTEEEARALYREDGYEEGKELGLAEGRAEGLAEGLAEGQGRINRLNQLLKEAGRIDDLLRALDESDFQEQLLEEFGL
ncbi:MAG: hypothetical protein IJ443_07325 [Firmicutes bacterium]|nr:hypothetical protein [Bacillota bacterium]